MSNNEKAIESEQLFSDVKDSQSVALDEINDNGEGLESVSGKIANNQPVKKRHVIDDILTFILDDDIAQLKQCREDCGDDDVFLQEALIIVLKNVESSTTMNCLEYILEVYDEMDEHSENLKEKINRMVDDTVKNALSYGAHTYIYWISISKDKTEKSTKILQRHSELVDPLLNLMYKGRTQLMDAVQRKNLEFAKCLIQCGADVTLKEQDGNGKPVIYHVAIMGLTDVLEVIFSVCQRQGIPKSTMLKNSDLYGEGHSIFFPALQSGNIELYEKLSREEDAEEMLKAEIEHKDFPILLCYLCEKGLQKIFKHLLEIDKTKVLTCYAEDGTTPLIWAAGKNRLGMVELMKLEYDEADMRICDKSGRGVVYYALANTRIVKYILSTSRQAEKHTVMLSIPDKENARTALEQAAIKGYRESAIELLRHGAHELFRKESVDKTYNFFANVQSMDLETLRAIFRFLEENCHDFWIDSLKRENSDSYPPLLAAARYGREDLVNLLLDKGADGLQTSSFEKKSALHCAVESESLSIVECLVGQIPSLCSLKTVDGKTALELAVKKNSPSCVKFLLASNLCDDEKEGLLHMALYRGSDNQEDLITEIILGLGIDHLKKEMQEKGTKTHLITMYPRAVVMLLNKCYEMTYTVGYDMISSNDNQETKKYNFFFLNDLTDYSTALDTMISLKREECLAHPVVEKFVELKWNSPAAKKWYYANLLVYAIFLICFTTHIVLHTEDPSFAASTGLKALSVFALILNSFNVIKELFQMWFNKDIYFYDFSNYVEWIVYISSFVYFVPLSGKNDRQIEAGAIGVFLAWVNFIWFLKRFSPLGIYIIMVKKIFMSLFMVLPIVILFIVAFGVAFLALMSNDEGFGNFPISLLTTSIMVTGEIDYRDVFLANERSPYRYLQRLFLVLIVMVGGIVLMNFLVGLAVDDTSKILERSEAEERFYKAVFVTALDRTLQSFSFLSSPKPIPDDYVIRKDYEWSKKVLDPHENENDQDVEDPLLSRVSALEKCNKKMAVQLEENGRQIEKMATTIESIWKHLRE